MEDKPLTEYGLSSTAKAQAQATMWLTFRDPGSEKSGTLEVTPLLSPPELSGVMKPPESQACTSTLWLTGRSLVPKERVSAFV